MELLVKAYDLPYSDTRLMQIETLLKALSNEPSENDTLKNEPLMIEKQKSIINDFIKKI